MRGSHLAPARALNPEGVSMKARVLVLAILAGFAGFALADERDNAERALEKAIGSSNKGDIKSSLAAATKPGDVRAAKLIVNDALKLRGFGMHEELLQAIKGITED